MTPEELEELLTDCPTLFHMAELGSWPSIRDTGLWSTSALLDIYGVNGEARLNVEARRRPAGVRLVANGLPDAVVRDQLPMDDVGLRRCLPDGWLPEDWYRLLNSKVFFWMSRDRLLRLLNADAYRNKAHDVLEVATAPLVAKYAEQIWFCPINSGCTKPVPHPRGPNTFSRIADYPYAVWRKKRKRGERIVELAVDYGICDIRDYVLRVTEMCGDDDIKEIFLASST